MRLSFVCLLVCFHLECKTWPRIQFNVEQLNFRLGSNQFNVRLGLVRLGLNNSNVSLDWVVFQSFQYKVRLG